MSVAQGDGKNMAKTCKYIERNQKEQKCSDYYDRHWSRLGRAVVKGDKRKRIECNRVGTTRFCRLTEWKRKHGTCPYDSSIQTQSKPKAGQLLLPGQRTI